MLAKTLKVLQTLSGDLTIIRERIKNVLKLIEQELGKEDDQKVGVAKEQYCSSGESNSSSEPEPIQDAPQNLSIYPPILVLEHKKDLESIMTSNHKVTGYKRCSQYFSRFPNQREDTHFLNKIFTALNTRQIDSQSTGAKSGTPSLKFPFIQPFLII